MTPPKTLRPADCCAHCAFADGTTSLMVMKCDMHAIQRAATDVCGDFVVEGVEEDDDECKG